MTERGRLRRCPECDRLFNSFVTLGDCPECSRRADQ
jgi:uncharacterized protein (DUF983 family)